MTKKTRSQWLVLCLSLAWLGACGSDPYAGGSSYLDTSTDTSTQTSVTGPDAGASDAPPWSDASSVVPGFSDIYITVAPIRQLDLVVMIDNSPSMAGKQAKFNAQLPKLLQALKDPSDGTLPDLRVAIIDSDLGTGGAYSSGSCGPNSNNGNMPYGDLGKFQMRGALGCGVTDSTASYLEYKNGHPVNFAGDISAVFACLATNVGTLGCGMEHQLQAFEFALTAKGIGNDQQRTMLREQAYLGLVFLTDEDDCSAATNDGMFGDKVELRGESASLRCATRSHACGGKNLTSSPPDYPTTAAFTSDVATCKARTDACPNATDGNPDDWTDTSVPTSCSPLKDVRKLAQEIKELKQNPDEQILVAGIFGVPIPGQNVPYKIDLVPNPNTADTAHPQVYDLWPICYDPQHFQATDASTYNADDVGWGATAGLRESAFVDEFGANGLKFSICESDYSGAMSGIGLAIAKKLTNLCVDAPLADADPIQPGVQPTCDLRISTPTVDLSGKIIYVESASSLPQCPAGSTNGNVAEDCWQFVDDPARCPVNGQLVTLLRTASEIETGPLAPGTKLHLRCQV